MTCECPPPLIDGGTRAMIFWNPAGAGGGLQIRPIGSGWLHVGGQNAVEGSGEVVTGASTADTQQQFREAASAFVAALRGLTAETRPVFTPVLYTPPTAPASVTGQAATLTAVGGSYSVLQTTHAINTQTTT